MSDMQVNAAVSSWQSQSAAQAPREQEKEDPSFTIYEMM